MQLPSAAIRYEFEFENEHIFEDCPDYPRNCYDDEQLYATLLQNSEYNITGYFRIDEDIKEEWRVS